MPSEVGSQESEAPLPKLVNLVLTEKEAIAVSLIQSIGVAMIVRDGMMARFLLTQYGIFHERFVGDDEEKVIGKKMDLIHSAISKETMDLYGLTTAEWP